jgi:hypothetical protein
VGAVPTLIVLVDNCPATLGLGSVGYNAAIGLESLPVDPDSGFVIPDEPPPPSGGSYNGMLHRQLIALLGMVIGELWKLDELAEDCAADGVYEFMLAARPLNVIGGVGSPPNALAIK